MDKKIKSPKERSEIALKAVETRRKRDPNWGKKGKDFKTVCWQDYEKLHEGLAIHCSKNDLVISNVYAELVRAYLKDPTIILSKK